MIRTFVGIELEESTVAELADEVAYLKRHAPGVRWVHTESMHLTLKFLGDVREQDLREVFDAVKTSVAGTDPFPLEVIGLGAFPDTTHPRTIWTGIGRGAMETTGLVSKLESALADCGYPKERKPYHPHVTLGRVKQPRDAEGLAEIYEDNKQTSFGLSDVGEIVVFMSELKKSGARYTPMQRVKLGEV